MLLNLSHKTLIYLTQRFNHILRFGYFPSAWKSTKVIPILKPGKPLSDPRSHKPISLLSTISKLQEQVVAHRLNSFIHQNHILPPEYLAYANNIQRSVNWPELPTSSPMALILEKTQDCLT